MLGAGNWALFKKPDLNAKKFAYSIAKQPLPHFAIKLEFNQHEIRHQSITINTMRLSRPIYYYSALNSRVT